MPDNYDIQESKSPDMARYLEIARRRYMQFLVPMLVGFLAVWGLTFVLNARYKSTTAILVEQPSMPKNYVMSNVGEDLQQQLDSISQQVLSRSRLLAISDQYQLFAKSKKPLSPDEKVALMSKKIDVQLVHGDTGGITSFSISYTADTPWLAQQVTRELANTVMSQDLALRQRESENTTSFLDQQLENARQNLQEQNEKVKAYEAAHQGSLPTQQQSNLSILAGLQQQLQSEQDALNAAQSQRGYYQTLIEQYRALRGPAKAADGTAVDVTALDQTLVKDRAQLADLLSRYTDSYPDVVALKAEIGRVQKERDAAVAAASAAAKEAAAGGADSSDPQNAPLVQLQGQLRANQIEVANRERSIEELKQRISQYEARLGGEPMSEAELADLTRGYDASQANYNELLKRRDESQMATNMEQLQQGERFSILDPASLPWKPDFPNRLEFCALGVVLGMVLGLITVILFEFMDDRLYSDKEIKALLPVAVISEIPEIENAAEERKARNKVYLGWATAAAVVVAVLAGAAVSVLHP